MKIRMTFEIDSADFGAFNVTGGSHGKPPRTSTLDKVSMAELVSVVQDAHDGGNDLLHASKLARVERGEETPSGRWVPVSIAGPGILETKAKKAKKT